MYWPTYTIYLNQNFNRTKISRICKEILPHVRINGNNFFLTSHLKETPKQYMEVCYRIFISALFREIFSLEIFSSPPSWKFVDMHDTSQLGSRDIFFSHDTMINMLP